MIDNYCSDMIKIERAVFINAIEFPPSQKALLSTYSITMLYSI